MIYILYNFFTYSPVIKNCILTYGIKIKLNNYLYNIFQNIASTLYHILSTVNQFSRNSNGISRLGSQLCQKQYSARNSYFFRKMPQLYRPSPGRVGKRDRGHLRQRETTIESMEGLAESYQFATRGERLSVSDVEKSRYA